MANPQQPCHSLHPRAALRRLASLMLLAACGAALSFGPPAAALEWSPLPEMVAPTDVVVAAPAERSWLAASTEGQAAVAAVERVVQEEWPRLRELDWLELSRNQREATRGWSPPESPLPLVGRALGRDAAGRLHVEVRGPRLPARYDIVFRFVHVFATYDPVTSAVGDLTVTIRGWIEE